MKKCIFLLVIFCSVLSCSNDKYNPNNYLTQEEQTALIDSTIRYSFKLAPRANHKSKFDTTFNSFYRAAATDYSLLAYYPVNDTLNYFLFSRNARSIWPVKETIGGKVGLKQNSAISYYEEVFRTWKLREDTAKTRGLFLFDLMAENKDLTPYWSKNKGDQYIEFPDGRFYFDAQKRLWRDKEMDSLLVN